MQPNEKTRILIVDDIKQSLKSMKRALQLEEPSWEFYTASNEEEAISTLKERLDLDETIAVLITDLDMKEEESGINLIREVQQIDPLLMSILYTGKPTLLDKYNTSEIGAFDVVVKAAPDQNAVQKILEKTRTALRYRSWAARINFLRRYFDPTLFETIENDPSFLEPRIIDVTIVFWDIRGFSALCDRLREDPSLVAGFLREYCQVAAQTIFQNAGLLDKFIGDGIMALFGIQDNTEQGRKAGAIAAIKAARELHAKYVEIIDQWMPKWKQRTTEAIQLHLGCGIHTGRALVGNLGTDFRDQFTAVGSHVNFAQRLESLANKDGKSPILVSQPTASYLEGVVDTTIFNTINDVKNIPGEHIVYVVGV